MTKCEILHGHVIAKLREMPKRSVHCCVTSPPYWGLRSYGTEPQIWGGRADCDHQFTPNGVRKAKPDRANSGHDENGSGIIGGERGGQAAKVARGPAIDHGNTCTICGAWRGELGLEPTPQPYSAHMMEVFAALWDVLRDDGTLWLNLGDSYAASGRGGGGGSFQNDDVGTKVTEENSRRKPPEGMKQKDLVGIPWMIAFALRDAGWYLRSEIIWCLSGGAWIYARTQKGDMPVMVKDLVRLRPETVLLWTGQKWTRVLGWGRSNDESEKIQLVLRSGERIGCTGGHLWPTQRGNVAARNLRMGDIVTCCSLPEPESGAPRFLTNDMLWLIGLYLAEGSRSDDTIQLSLHADELKWLTRIADVAAHLGGSTTHTRDGNVLSVRLYGRMLVALVEEYVGGRTALDKHLRVGVWRMANYSLKHVVDGYLDGDGSHEVQNGRHRLGFCRNYALERDLRTAAARLGATITLNPCTVQYQRGTREAFRGEWRWSRSGHHNEKDRGEIVAIEKSRARKFWDIAVEDEPHLFALASGVLTHNCKPNPMPESCSDRPTKSHEQIFLLTKSPRYFYDAFAAREQTSGTANPRGNGVNPKAIKQPSGWDTSADRSHVSRVGRFPVGKQNESFSSAVNQLVANRNWRDVWTITTQAFPGAHYATFPTEVARRCIIAGTSEGGCCAVCGAPLERIIELGEPLAEQQKACGGDANGEYFGEATKDYAAGGAQDPSAVKARILAGMREKKTVGWERTCECDDAGVKPCTVLDIFGGSGTVGEVAESLGRNAVLIELLTANIGLIEKRTAQPGMVFA